MSHDMEKNVSQNSCQGGTIIIAHVYHASACQYSLLFSRVQATIGYFMSDVTFIKQSV